MRERIKLDPFGVTIDTNPHDVDESVYTDALNMRFTNNAAEKMYGETEGTTITEQATHLLFNGDHSAPRWIYMGDGLVRTTDFATDTDLSNVATVASGTNWDATLFNTLPILNNTVDAPWYWDKSLASDVAALPAFPASTTCEAIRPFRSFLIALNITESGTEQVNRLIWSDSSDAGALPASWDIADPTTLAGDAYLTDDRGEIVDGCQLRDMFVIYKTHSIYLMRLIGGSSVMRVDKVQVNSGLLAKNCVTEFKGRHFVFGDGDIYLFDGQNIESIANKRVRNKIFNDIDSTNSPSSYVVRNDQLNEIWLCYPESGSTYSNKAAIWNWEDNSWTFRSLPDSRHIAAGLTNFIASPTYAASTGTYASYAGTTYSPASANATADSLASAATLAINTLEETNDIDGVAMPSKLEKLTMALGDEDQIKLISSVTPRITANAGTTIYIRIGTQNMPDDTISWSSEVAYVVGTDREAYFTEKGRYISIRMRTQDTDTHWKCHGFSFDFNYSGKH